MSDSDLVRLALAGNRAAIRFLYDRYHDEVWRAVIPIVKHIPEARQVVNNTFAKMYHKLHTYDVTRPFGPWVRTIARNEAREYYATSKRNIASVSLDALTATGYDAPDYTTYSDPARRYYWAQELRETMTDIGELPVMQRAAIQWHCIEGQSYPEMSLSMGVPASTLRTWVTRTRTQLLRKRDARRYPGRSDWFRAPGIEAGGRRRSQDADDD